MWRGFRRIAALGGAATLGVALTGCASMSGGVGVDRERLREMPSEVAWQHLEDKARDTDTLARLTGNEIAATYANYMAEEKSNAEAQAANATTPREALERMVADISDELQRALPADARRRGIDRYRLNIAMGDLVNRDQDPALRGALSLVKRNLEDDREFRDQFGFITFDQDEADEIIELATDNPSIWTDPTGEAGDGRSLDYSPDSLYVVVGEAWINRNPGDYELTVWTDIEATHVQSRRSAGGETFSRTYYYHPGFGGFISKAENDRLREQWRRSRSGG